MTIERRDSSGAASFVATKFASNSCFSWLSVCAEPINAFCRITPKLGSSKARSMMTRSTLLLLFELRHFLGKSIQEIYRVFFAFSIACGW